MADDDARAPVAAGLQYRTRRPRTHAALGNFHEMQIHPRQRHKLSERYAGICKILYLYTYINKHTCPRNRAQTEYIDTVFILKN